MATLPNLSKTLTVQMVVASYEQKQESGYRYHLGASLIGTKCERSLWYSHRWATRQTFEGRMLRLFQTGHLAESRFVADLRAIGCEVHDHEFLDPDQYAENYDRPVKQISVRDEFGHFGGSLDAMLIGVPEEPCIWHVGEFKTHSAKSFTLLTRDGVEKAKPRHYAQMQVYMHFIGANWALYLAVNKDTDELYAERVRYSPGEAEALVTKANRVIQSPRPPRKLSNDPAWFECRFCEHHAVCHGDTTPERHCRSCMHSTPVAGGKWSCVANFGDPDLSRETQDAGCGAHRYIPDLIHGEQTDAVEATPGNWLITYVLTGGGTFIDGAM